MGDKTILEVSNAVDIQLKLKLQLQFFFLYTYQQVIFNVQFIIGVNRGIAKN